jgi:hypothetical protein
MRDEHISTDKRKNSLTYFSGAQLGVIGLLAAAIAIASQYIHLPVAAPGSTGVIWLALLILAAGLVPQRGAATLTSILAGGLVLLWPLADSGNQGLLTTLAVYTVVGVGVDLGLLLLGSPRQVLAASLAAIIGYLGRFVIGWAANLADGVPVGLVSTSLADKALAYVIFALIGGLIGSLMLRGLDRTGLFNQPTATTQEL